MKKHRGGLSNFLNAVTQSADKSDSSRASEQIVYIDIDDLEPNPKNFYGLRDVDALAGLISVSRLIEPLTVSQKSDGKYMIISGHRRRAAVEKLLEEGVYTERKLPCIIKSRGKISIEQEDGAIIEFDEDAVEMLNLIASNRGQREERTIDEKLQEVRYLESFAKAIYHQKDRRARGRFRSFFAEEILNISKSQLQRINSMEKLTDKVNRALDAKKIVETAAMELATLTPEEQDACLEKILSGELKGTVQDIQNFKLSQSHESASVRKKKFSAGRKASLPKDFDDPQKEAHEWFYREQLASYEKIYDAAKRMSATETDELNAAQWEIRASVARYNIEELKRNHEENFFSAGNQINPQSENFPP